MRKVISLALVCLVVCLFGAYAKDAKRLYIYQDKNSSGNHFIPSGWMGDQGDLQFTDQATDECVSGATSIRIGYSGKKTHGQGWVGIYWQSAEHNWGEQDTGLDLSDFKLTVSYF